MTQQTAQRPNTQEMVVVHRVFRREFGLAPALVRAVAADDRERAEVVAAHLAEMTTMLHHHHTGEDELVWPLLQERAELRDDLLARMEAQHATVGALLERVDELLPVWRATAGAGSRDELAGVLAQVSTALDAHLDEEEREVLPLAGQHMTAAEWDQLGQRGMAAIPRSRMLVLLGGILEEASPEESAMFLAMLPPPARLAYRLVGRRRYERETAALRRGVVVPQQRRG